MITLYAQDLSLAPLLEHATSLLRCNGIICNTIAPENAACINAVGVEDVRDRLQKQIDPGDEAIHAYLREKAPFIQEAMDAAAREYLDEEIKAGAFTGAVNTASTLGTLYEVQQFIEEKGQADDEIVLLGDRLNDAITQLEALLTP